MTDEVSVNLDPLCSFVADPDRLTKALDIGPYVLWRRLRARGHASPPPRHDRNLYVLSDKGIFVTGTAIKNPEVLARRPILPNGENAARPGDRGAFEGPTVTRTLVAGDVVFVPPLTPHLLKDSNGAFDYLVFRINPGHVIPAPFTSADLK